MEDNLQHPPFPTRDLLKWASKEQFRIRLAVAGDIAGTVSMRVMTRQSLSDAERDTSDDGLIQERILGVDDFPVFVGIVDRDNAFDPGQCWASATLEIGGQEAITLCSGFVFGNKGVSWPNANLADPNPNLGRVTSLDTADPAAGAETTITVPAGELWRLLGANVDLVTDSTATNRRPALHISDGANLDLVFTNGSDHVADLTHHVVWSHYGDTPVRLKDNNSFNIIPAWLYVPPGGVISTVTANLQAGDNYGAMSLIVEKFVGQVKSA